MSWKIGSRYGNKFTEILDEDDNLVCIVVTHEVDPALVRRPKHQDDFVPIEQGMANAKRIAVSHDLEAAAKAFLEQATATNQDALRKVLEIM